MALNPALKSLHIAGSSGAKHTLDIFLDYVCPFSAKMSRAIDSIMDLLNNDYAESVKVILRPQVQPWHASSTFTHEAALAVARVSPENFWRFSCLLFDHQDDYFDIPSSTMTPLQIREKLAGLAAQVIPNKIDDFKDLLKLKTTPNGGVDVTNDLKYTIRFSRQNGIHMSPTVMWDGLIVNEIDSSWDKEKWSKFLAEKTK